MTIFDSANLSCCLQVTFGASVEGVVRETLIPQNKENGAQMFEGAKGAVQQTVPSDLVYIELGYMY